MPEKRSSFKNVVKSQKSPGHPFEAQDGSPAKYILKLYISGMTRKSILAIEAIQSICQTHLPGRCELEVIDIIQHPALAKEAQIVATPTLIKKSPLPVHRLIGDMYKTKQVLSGLDLISRN